MLRLQGKIATSIWVITGLFYSFHATGLRLFLCLIGWRIINFVIKPTVINYCALWCRRYPNPIFVYLISVYF